MKPVIVVFLQNPWSEKYAGRRWPREKWLQALAKSRSGQRLRVLEETAQFGQERFEFWYDNANPRVGSTPDSLFAPDPTHMLGVLRVKRPQIVVTCGRHAEKAIADLWDGPVLAVPHPAHRLLTNDLYAVAGRLIRNGYGARLALRQLKGNVGIDEKIFKTTTDAVRSAPSGLAPLSPDAA